MKQISDIFKQNTQRKKPPAYRWQDLALRVIQELNIPEKKKSSIFMVCKKYDRNFIEKCMDDTKELCESGEKWKYFFKLIANEKKNTAQ